MLSSCSWVGQYWCIRRSGHGCGLVDEKTTASVFAASCVRARQGAARCGSCLRSTRCGSGRAGISVLSAGLAVVRRACRSPEGRDRRWLRWIPWEQVRGEVDSLTVASVRAYITALGGTIKIVASLDDTDVTLRLPSDPRSTAA